MGDRSARTPAVVLRARESPGGDRIVTFLSPEEGLVDAFAFGGPKSKLRSLAAPYHAGIAWIYRDPVRGFTKLTDFDAERDFSGIREDLARLWAAGFFAEALVATHAGGGELAAVFALTLDALATLDAADAPRVDLCVVQFVQRLASCSGIAPEYGVCASCGEGGDDRGIYAWSSREPAFLCRECAAETTDSIPMPAGAVRYLERTAALSWADAARVGADDSTRAALRAWALSFMNRACDGRLRTLAEGAFTA